MRVSADDQIDAPRRIDSFGELLVLLESDMGEQDGQIDAGSAICIADALYLAQGVRGLHERADVADIPALIEDGFGDDADEEILIPETSIMRNGSNSRS